MLKYKRFYDWGGLLLWITAFVVIMTISMHNPDKRSVVDNYRAGSELFLAGQPLYDIESAVGYLYPPSFAAFYAPFLKLGPYVGDALWRLLGFAVLTFAAARQVRTIGAENRLWMLSYALFLAIPITLGAVRNGQATILLTGACWLLTLSALEGKRAETFLWASLALIAKPTAIVLLLLLGAVRLRLIPYLVLSVAFVLALPYAVAPFDYVSGQYGDFLALTNSMSLDKSEAFTPSDFTAPLNALGLAISGEAAFVMRLVAAALTLGAVVWFERRLDRRLAGLVIFIIAAFYMLLFNPRAEYNTFCMLAMPCGVAIAYLWQVEGRGALRIVLAVALFATGLSGLFVSVHHLLHLWFRPVIMTAVTLPLLWWFTTRVRRAQSGEGRGVHA